MKEKIINLSAKNRPYSSFFGPLHKYLVEKYTPFLAEYTETYILTSLTFLWSCLVFLVGYFVNDRGLFFLSLASLIFFQFLTDIFDGAVGRYKNSGLVKWGFYVDHFLDFTFTIALIFAYSNFFQLNQLNLFLIFSLTLLFMAHELLLAILKAGRLNSNGYHGFGTIELRFSFILLNILLIFIKIEKVDTIITLFLVPGFIFLFFQVFRTQRKFWLQELKKISEL